jgi:hypothetical protein
MYAYICCLADRSGEYFAFCEIEVSDTGQAIEQAWDIAETFSNFVCMTVFLGDVRVFTNIPKARRLRRAAVDD